MEFRLDKSAKKYLHTIMLVALLILTTLFSQNASSSNQDFSKFQVNFDGGTGTLQDPFLISNVEQLQAVKLSPNNAHYKLTGSFDAAVTVNWNNGSGFDPIGWFGGTLDGNNQTINGLVINRPGSNQAALFTQIGPNAIIKDLNIENITVIGGNNTAAIAGAISGKVQNVTVTGSISGSGNVGGLVGQSYSNSNIVNCHVDLGVSGSQNNIGGLVGYNNSGIIEDCSSSGIVQGQNEVGGIAGKSEGIIVNCHSAADVYGQASVGGLSGLINNGSIENSYSTGIVNGISQVGGLAGFLGWSLNAYIKCSFSTATVTGSGNEIGGLVGKIQGGFVENTFARGTVIGNNRVGGLIGQVLWGTVVKHSYSTTVVLGSGGQTGGLIGRMQGANINNSFWDTQASGLNNSSGGTPKNTLQMKTIATFTNAGWNFNTIWGMQEYINDGYPYLIVMNVTHDVEWTGSVSRAWETSGNWSNNKIPKVNDKVIIPPVANQPLISSPAEVQDIDISQNSFVTIAHNGSLTVEGTINNHAGESGLVIRSNQYGTGSLLHHTKYVAASFDKYFSGVPESWHLISAPVATQAISPDFTPAGSYGDGTGYDLYCWHEPDTSWIYYNHPEYWSQTHVSDIFKIGVGYLVSYQETNPVKTFSGHLNNGSVNIPLSKTEGIGNEFGFNLAGNPYPSSIDWKSPSGWDRANLELSSGGYDIYVWNDVAYNYGVYNSASTSDEGTLGVTRYIAPTQGFFVRAAQSGNLTMNNEVRVHQGAGSWLKGMGSIKELLHIVVTSQDEFGSDEVLIEFNPYSQQQGSPKKFSFVKNAPSLFIPGNGQFYSFCTFDQVLMQPVIPLAFKAGEKGTYSLRANFDTDYFEMVELIDTQSGQRHNLKEKPVFDFFASDTDQSNRFVIQLQPGLYANPHDAIPARIFAWDNIIYIDMQLVDEDCTMELFDLSGRRIRKETFRGGTTHSFSHTSPGLYIARLTGTTGILSKKIFLQ
jgi:hypothetical protein